MTDICRVEHLWRSLTWAEAMEPPPPNVLKKMPNASLVSVCAKCGCKEWVGCPPLDASPAGAGGTATRSEGQGLTSARNGPKPGGTHIVIGLVPPFDTDDGERP